MQELRSLGISARSIPDERPPDNFVPFLRQKRRYVQSVAGGTLMGYGAGIAVGCTIGAFFSAIPSLGLSGWVFGVALLAGAGLGTQIIRRIA